ncbi:sensor histidine kinase [Thermoactinospora rubra]|uniref:sensor histidine kinase n=1 Tax=Thermoactinospora rubra TaxID=1088767 RepID=UPI000A0F445C|nr:sensor histidine kinase [Thermoactinospora rubra]
MFTTRLTRSQLIALDCVAAVAFSLVLSTSTGGWAPAAALGLPLAVRRVWPRAVFAIVLAAAVPAMALHLVDYAFLAPAYALYVVALSERPRAPVTSLGIATLALMGLLLVSGAPAEARPAWLDAVVEGVLGVAALAGAWTVGSAVRERRMLAARETERAVMEERLRIARELHDVVTHSVGLIAVKAGVANHVVDRRPEEAKAALRVIEEVGKEALAEMRRMLGVLRTEPQLHPAPGLGRLRELADRARLAGVDVSLDVRVDRPLPGGVELAAYRIVQEAITNVVRHAAPASCTVVVEAGDELSIEVTDDGPGGTAEPGHGLLGMRERVMMYGGAFTAGPLPGRGFAVRARLPL